MIGFGAQSRLKNEAKPRSKIRLNTETLFSRVMNNLFIIL